MKTLSIATLPALAAGCLALLVGAIPVSADLSQGLVAHYPFDGNASDVSGNGNHGTVHGATLGSNRHGDAGKAYDFDGVNDYVRVPHHSSLNFGGNSFTLSTWAYARATKGRIINKGISNNIYSLEALVGNESIGQPALLLRDNSTPIAKGSASLLDQSWHLISGVRDANSGKIHIFMDGKPAGTDNFSGSISNTADLLIGSASHAPVNFNGLLDDVRIYSRALSAAEVAALYQLEKPNTPPVISEGGPLTLSVTEDSGPVAWTTWDRRFGGSESDNVRDVIATTDGGYLLVGDTNSSAGGEKTEASRGDKDYWAIKIDANGSKVWDKRFGGSGKDLCKSVVATNDGGYLLVGDSNSSIGGDKTQASRGGADYWAVKIDANGSKVWDKRFGCTGNDYCSDAIMTTDGGYLLGGYSAGPADGDKTQTSWGSYDFWLVKINSSGEKVWDKRFGGSLDDRCKSVIATPDGGYLLSGNSYSDANGDKSETGRGHWDYWAVKINGNGAKVWDKRFGGSEHEVCYDVVATSDGGYLLTGYSESGENGDKSETSRGGKDYWAVKINGDGAKVWDKRFGGSEHEVCYGAVATSDGGCLLTGYSESGENGDKSEKGQGASDYWAVKIDFNGTKVWDMGFGGTGEDRGRVVIPAQGGGYLLAGYSGSGAGGDKSEGNRGHADFWAIKINADGNRTLRAADGDGDALTWSLETNATHGTAVVAGAGPSPSALTYQPDKDFNGTDSFVVKVTDGNRSDLITVNVTVADDPDSDNDDDGFTDAQETAYGSDPDSNASKPGLDFGLVAYYPFDGNASDMSGNGNHGTVNGATLGPDRHGNAGKAYAFDGVEDYIQAPNKPSLQLTQFTVSAWIKSIVTASGTRAILLKDNHIGENYGIWQTIDSQGDAAISFQYYPISNQGGQGLGGGIVAMDSYTMVTVMTDSQKIKIHLNGQFKAEAGVSSVPGIGQEPLYFGYDGGFGYSKFKGSIDEVRIYNRALSAAEVAALYQLESTPPNRPPSAIDLNGTSVAENLPAGTVIGDFNATDPDINATHSFTLVEGNGSTHNNLFILDANGTLKTAIILDYEANATLSIRVNAKDEYNASVERKFTVTLTNVSYEPSRPNHLVALHSTGNLEMIWVEPGTFTMGSPVTETGRANDENEHNVTLTQGFYLGKYEVTQAEWLAVMGTSPSSFSGNNRPVEQVSWDDVKVFLDRLNAAEQKAGRLAAGWRYALPTEAQWEYACRAGSNTAYFWGNEINSSHANWNHNGSVSQTVPVGQYQPNPWGFFDMHGNVTEWCLDFYGAYENGPLIDPHGPNIGSTRVLRSGSWRTPPSPRYVRSAFRGDQESSFKQDNLGFRLALINTMPAGSVTLDKLAPELRDLLDGNGTIEQALPAGTVIAVKPGDPAPAGYTLFQRNEYNATLTWEEKAPVSVGRQGGDGAEILDGKIYFVGGYENGTTYNLAERYDPVTNQWETLNPMNTARDGMAATVLNGKLYTIGGIGLTSVEIYDPQTGQWSAGPALPSEVKSGNAITVDGKILLVGGQNSSNQHLSQVLQYDPTTNQWSQKAPMLTPRYGMKLVLLAGKVWAIGGEGNAGHLNKVEIYDVTNDSWSTGPALTTARLLPSVWVSNDRVYVAGGVSDGSSFLNSVEVYYPDANQWIPTNVLPQNKYRAGTAVIGGKAYVVGGRSASGVYTNKVFAADLPAPAMDLYFKDGNATAEAATSHSLDGNVSVTLNMLAPDALAKLDVNQTHAQSAGSVIAVPKDSAPPAGYSLYKRSDRNSTLVWEERASVSVGRAAHDGVEVLDGKIYFVGGYLNGTRYTLAERFDPATNQWKSLNPMSVARAGLAATVLNGKLYAIGGEGLSSVEIYDPQTGQWSAGPALPSAVNRGTAITVGGKILLVGGHSGTQNFNQVLELDPITNQWAQKAAMPTARHGLKLVLLEGNVWAIGGSDGSDSNKVEIYNATNDSWTTGPPLTIARFWPSAWVANGRIYAMGGRAGGSTFLNSIEVYDPATNKWTAAGTLPQNMFCPDTAVLGGKVYVVAGAQNNNTYSNKVFAADVTPPMDLYFRDANVTGTITLSKLSAEVVSKLDGNASALPPIGAVTAIDHHDQVPTDHAILERADRNATHVWEEMAPVLDNRYAHDGVEALNGKIYFVGGSDNGDVKNIAERFDPATNQWETLNPMSTARGGVAATVLNGKLYAIGGSGLSSVEIYDPQTGQWSAGPTLPSVVGGGTAITVGGKIFLMGGQAAAQNINQVLELDPVTNQWSQKAPLPTVRNGMKLVFFNGKIWVIAAGNENPLPNKVDIYDVADDSWTTGPSLTTPRAWASAWAENGRIYVAGGKEGNIYRNSIEVYDPISNQWTAAGTMPENKYSGDATVLDGKVYVVAGRRSGGSNDYSNKVFAADLIPHRDLYFRESNATAPGGDANGSQPPHNHAPTAIDLNGTSVAENLPAASVVGDFNATDPDANATHVFALVEGNGSTHNNLFTLDANGTLRTLVSLDHEANATRSIRVRATDERNSTFEKVFVISVTDVLENSPPSFGEANASISTAENNASAFLVAATDPDADVNLVYSKSGPDAGKFILNVATGQLTFANPPDYENPTDADQDGVYEVILSVTDGTASISKDLTITVGDVFENRAPTGIDLNGTSVAENLPAATVVGEFNATDPDANATHVFALVDGNGSQHNNLFIIDANGTLKTATILDHKTNATLSIRARATDDHNASLEKVFVVTVTNDFSATVDALVGSASGLDAVEGNLTLWLDASNVNGNGNNGLSNGDAIATWVDLAGGNDNATAQPGTQPVFKTNGINNKNSIHFTRDRMTIFNGIDIQVDQARTVFFVIRSLSTAPNSEFFGTTTGKMLDIGTWSRQNRLRVRNTDNSFSATNSLMLNENYLLMVRYTGSSTEAFLDGHEIISVASNRFGYKLNNNLGIGWARREGRELVDAYLSEILVFDASLSNEHIVGTNYYLAKKWGLTGTVDSDGDGVTDALEIAGDSDPTNSESLPNNPPSVIQLTNTSIPENHPAGTIVSDFNATDPDANATHSFTLVDGNGSTHNNLFTIDANGTLKTATILDHEANATRSIRVRATDEHNASFEKAFTITVLDDPADNNASVADSNTTVSDNNGTAQDTNATVQDTNATVPDANGTIPDANATVPDVNATVPDGNATVPDTNATVPDTNATVPDTNTTLPDTNATVPDSNGTIPDANATAPDANATVQDTNATLPDTNATVPDTNATVQDTNATQPDTNATIPDGNATSQDGNATSVSDENESVVIPAPIYPPIARTLPGVVEANGKLRLSGRILTDGGSPVTLVGFLLSSSLRIDPADPKTVRLTATLSGTTFGLLAEPPDPGRRIYFRTFARNAAGETYGVRKRVNLPDPPATPQPWWSSVEEAASGWRHSPWFGSFLPYSSGWLYHADLGWLYAQPDETDGLWLWMEGKGWLWTNPGAYPYLFRHESSVWLYFLERKDGRVRFYNHATGGVE